MSEPLLILILLTATIALSASPLASAQEIETAPESDWKAFMPDRGMISEQPADQWQDALVSGNGRMGAMVFGSPDERIILTHHRFNQPQSPDPVPVPDMAAYLPELRRLIRAGQYKEAATHWTNGMKAEGHPIALTKTEQREWPDIIWTDAVHPGYAIEAATSPKGAVRDYLRRTNFGTGEIGVQWTDDRGAWRSRLFVSRAADVVVYEIFPPRKGEVRFRIDEDLEGLDRRDRDAWPQLKDDFRAQFAIEYARGDAKNEAWLTVRGHYNPERSAKGFEGITRIVTRDGTVRVRDDEVRVRGASSIVAVTRLSRLEDYAESRIAAVQRDIEKLDTDYDALLSDHAALHTAMYDRVRLDLNVGEARYLSVEALIREQKKGREAGEALNLALLEKLFDMGRYVFLCSSGDWPPRLQGIWGGSWDPAWRGDYTLDANVNLAVSGGNLGAMHEAMGGYLRLVEGVVDDWRTNARNLYGCRGILAGTRTDGDHNLHTHHSVAFPGHFWVAGTEWMVLPLHEYYEVTGDEAFLRDHVLPLLKEIALFYEDFLTEFDDDGNYVFVPSYSPEHAPENADNATVLNATMDIAAAKETLTNLIEACEILGVEQENLPKWRAMLTKMPAYLVNDEGALKEWAHPDLDDDYDHRHLSHLYPLWPGHEINPEDTPDLYSAARKAAHLRKMGNESAHGLMHMGLVAARLKDDAIISRNLSHLLTNDYLYSSLVTSHNPKHRIYNVDASCSLPAIVLEMLVYSRPGIVEVLPALPETLSKGSVSGVLCRGQVRVDVLTWDTDANAVDIKLTSSKDQEITLIYRKGIKALSMDGAGVRANGDRATLRLKAGQQHILQLQSAE